MAPFRVLQVFTIMNRGGAESMIMNYYRAIDREKVQFDFLVHRKEKAAFDDEIESLGGKIYRFNPINPLFPYRYYHRLRNFFNMHQEYKVIHSHLNTFSCFPLKIAQEFNLPCRIAHAHIAIDTINFASIITQKEGLKEGLKKIIKLQLKKRIHQHASHCFSCGEKAGKWLFGKNTSFTTMNNAIDTSAFVYNRKDEADYKKLHNLEKSLVLGHVGRFTSQKNHSFLLKIFAALLRTGANGHLVLIGDGPLRNDLETEAKNLGIFNNVKFLGVRPDIPRLLQMLDIFVFPSFYEGLPVTLIEAQAAGLKIFASDTITKEVGLTGDIEFLSIEESAEFWANKILLENSFEKKDNREKIIRGGYDIVANTHKIQEFYLQQLSK